MELTLLIACISIIVLFLVIGDMFTRIRDLERMEIEKANEILNQHELCILMSNIIGDILKRHPELLPDDLQQAFIEAGKSEDGG